MLVPSFGSAQLERPEGYVLTLREHVLSRLRGGRDAPTVPVVEVSTTRVYSCLLPLIVRAQVAPPRVRLFLDGLAPVFDVSRSDGSRDGICPARVPSGVFELEVVAGSAAISIPCAYRLDRDGHAASGEVLVVHDTGVPSRSAQHRSRCAVRCHGFRRVQTRRTIRLPRCRADAGRQPRRTRVLVWLRGWMAVPCDRGGTARASIFHYAEPEDWRRAYDLLQGYSHRTMARLAPNAWVELQN
jgi:hypothetical protein